MTSNKNEKIQAVFGSLSFLITFDLLLSTTGAYFIDKKEIILENWQNWISDWYLIPIIFLAMTFVLFNLFKNKMSPRRLFFVNNLLLIGIILNVLVLLSSAHPLLISPEIMIITLATSVACRIFVSIIILLMLFSELFN